ncbi:MAG: Crp/Fnr family transcriptional regulator [Desulfomonilaceae bacterium]
MTNHLAEQIGSIPMFDGLPAENHEALARIAVQKKFGKGETIFSEGDVANGFYVVDRGKVKIYKISFEGKEQIIHIFGPGEPFGEVPMFEGKHFPAHAIAMEESSVIFFPRSSFVHLIQTNPSLALNMLAVLSRRLRGLTVLVEDLSLREVPARLASHLLYLSNLKRGAQQFKLDLPKGQLAGLLGTIPETMSRITSKMVKSGLIRIDGSTITILDRDALLELSEGERRL